MFNHSPDAFRQWQFSMFTSFSEHFFDWWPAALIGLMALLGASPDSNAQTLLALI